MMLFTNYLRRHILVVLCSTACSSDVGAPHETGEAGGGTGETGTTGEKYPQLVGEYELQTKRYLFDLEPTANGFATIEGWDVDGVPAVWNMSSRGDSLGRTIITNEYPNMRLAVSEDQTMYIAGSVITSDGSVGILQIVSADGELLSSHDLDIGLQGTVYDIDTTDNEVIIVGNEHLSRGGFVIQTDRAGSIRRNTIWNKEIYGIAIAEDGFMLATIEVEIEGEGEDANEIETAIISYAGDDGAEVWSRQPSGTSRRVRVAAGFDGEAVVTVSAAANEMHVEAYTKDGAQTFHETISCPENGSAVVRELLHPNFIASECAIGELAEQHVVTFVSQISKGNEVWRWRAPLAAQAFDTFLEAATTTETGFAMLVQDYEEHLDPDFQRESWWRLITFEVGQ